MLKKEHITAEVDFNGESGRWQVTTIEGEWGSFHNPRLKYFKNRDKASKYAHNLQNRYSSVSIRE